MQNALWSLLIGMLAMLRTCGLAVWSAFDLQAGLSGGPVRRAIWLTPDLDASRLDAVSRSFYWGGSGIGPDRVAVDPAPLTAAVLRPVDDAPESIWWLGA